MRQNIIEINTKSEMIWISIYVNEKGNIFQEVADPWDVVKW